LPYRQRLPLERLRQRRWHLSIDLGAMRARAGRIADRLRRPPLGKTRRTTAFSASITPECRQCKSCLSRRPSLHGDPRATQGKGPDAGRHPRASAYQGPPSTTLHGLLCVSTYSGVAWKSRGEDIRDDGPLRRFFAIYRLTARPPTGSAPWSHRQCQTPGSMSSYAVLRHRPQGHPGAKMVGANRIIGASTSLT